MKKLYLSGEAAALKEAYSELRGVEAVTGGIAEASNELKIKGVEIDYNPKKIDICELLKTYFDVVDPYVLAEDPLLQPAVVYCSSEDVPQIEYYARYMQSRGAEPAAALGNLIMNDSITPGREIRRMLVNYGRLVKFTGEEA